MIYRIQKKDNGYMIQQQEHDGASWLMAEKTGFYKQKGSAGSRVRQLRHQEQGKPSSLGARAMSSPRFCVVDS